MRACIIALLTVLLASCADNAFVSTPAEGWGRTDTLTLRPYSLAGDGEQQAMLVVRVDRTFRYRQLRLKMNDQRIVVPVEMQHGVGVCEATLPITLTEADTLLYITHLMWSNPLQGVLAIGVDWNY